MTLTTESLASLLREASEAHHSYEASLGHPDANWPDWYAQYIADHATALDSSAVCPTCGLGVVYPAFPVIGSGYGLADYNRAGFDDEQNAVLHINSLPWGSL